jgi:hypothetical protein
VRVLLGEERARYTSLLDALALEGQAPDALRNAARRVDDLRYQSLRGSDPLSD